MKLVVRETNVRLWCFWRLVIVTSVMRCTVQNLDSSSNHKMHHNGNTESSNVCFTGTTKAIMFAEHKVPAIIQPTKGINTNVAVGSQMPKCTEGSGLGKNRLSAGETFNS